MNTENHLPEWCPSTTTTRCDWPTKSVVPTATTIMAFTVVGVIGGMAIGNPLYISPLYKNNGTLNFIGTRFKAHHLG